MVSELELDDLDLSGRLELLDERCLFDYLGWNDVLLRRAGNGTDWVYPAGGRSSSSSLRLQVAVYEVDLLQATQALADVLCPDLPHALNRLELGVG
jgi:hypothetical protein